MNFHLRELRRSDMLTYGAQRILFPFIHAPSRAYPVWSLLLLPLLLSCNQKNPAATSVKSNKSPMPLAVDSRVNLPTEIEYNAGVLLTNCTTTHDFSIRNPSEVPWTFQELRVGCTCTSATISAQVIEPHTTGYVKVSFRAGSSSADAQQSISVVFAESTAPPLTLRFVAKVQSPITVLPQSVSLKATVTDFDIDSAKDLSVVNYTKERWGTITAAFSEPWLEATVSPSDEAAPTGAVEAYAIKLLRRTGGMKPGRYSGTLSILTGDRVSSKPAIVPVSFSLIHPVAVSPSSFFFGDISDGKSVPTTVTLTFAEPTLPSQDIQIVVGATLRDQLSVSWEPVAPSIWKMKAQLSPATVGILDGEVIVDFKKTGFPVLHIPVLARIHHK